MAHHHKSNQAVEGDPDSGHGRGLPRRPDEEELAERTVQDRLNAGLRGGPSPTSEAEYGQGQVEIDAEVEAGPGVSVHQPHHAHGSAGGSTGGSG